jgi:hypothetical protein
LIFLPVNHSHCYEIFSHVNHHSHEHENLLHVMSHLDPYWFYVEMCVDVADSMAKENIVSVRIDRSSGNPDVQILKTDRTEEVGTLPVRIDQSSGNPDDKVSTKTKGDNCGIN